MGNAIWPLLDIANLCYVCVCMFIYICKYVTIKLCSIYVYCIYRILNMYILNKLCAVLFVLIICYCATSAQ